MLGRSSSIQLGCMLCDMYLQFFVTRINCSMSLPICNYLLKNEPNNWNISLVTLCDQDNSSKKVGQKWTFKSKVSLVHSNCRNLYFPFLQTLWLFVSVSLKKVSILIPKAKRNIWHSHWLRKTQDLKYWKRLSEFDFEFLCWGGVSAWSIVLCDATERLLLKLQEELSMETLKSCL